MLEIDGEFFEDPYTAYYVSTMIDMIMKGQIRMAQLAYAVAQPLFPPKVAEGGIVPDYVLKGDIINLPGEKK